MNNEENLAKRCDETGDYIGGIMHRCKADKLNDKRISVEIPLKNKDGSTVKIKATKIVKDSK